MRLDHVNAGYGKKVVVNDACLEFHPGQLTVILGKNGSGKSTLVKTAAGLLEPLSGKVLADDKDFSKLSPKEKASLACYIEAGRRPASLPVKTLVLHGRFARSSWPRHYTKEDGQAAQLAMEEMGISDLKNRRMDELSMGQRQKAYLALALCQDADSIFMDEPSSFLDPKSKFDLMDLARQMANKGKAVTIILHDLDLAFQYADRIVLVDDHKIAFDGSVSEFLNQGLAQSVFEVQTQVLDGNRVLISKLDQNE